MASRYQHRFWFYVSHRKYRKLRRLLQRHWEEVDLNETLGSKKRTALHQSCARQDHKTAAVLLKFGADPSVLDRRGDTSLHVAARKVARKQGTVYEDLFLPLRKHCPSAMKIRNRKGRTPGDLLAPEEEKWGPQEELGDETKSEAEREWCQKLLGEWEDEYWKSGWMYEDDFCTIDPEPETYEDWANRISQEYRQKHQRAKEQPRRRPQTAPSKPPLKLQGLLQEEHLLYEKRLQAKEEELKEAKRRRYEEGCAQEFSCDSSRILRYKDIPWPCPTGTPQEMAAVALHGVDPSDKAGYRRFLRRQQAMWHPDKFLQLCGSRLAERDRRRILDTVTALSQEFNRLAEAAK